ncbi:MAG: type I-G CRISPR-associated RAMP protein Csb1/Cas7g [Solirubrobacteraceae bacterium]
MRQDLEPAAGLPVLPPSYEEPLEIHQRYVDGEVVGVIELDSVGSSANRLEEVLVALHRAGEYPLPVASTTVAPGDGSTPITITTLEMPHRVFDAWLRLSDGDANGTPFERTSLGEELALAHPRALDPLLETSAHDLVLGAWDSHRKGPAGQLRIARSFTSTLIGLNPVVLRQVAARRDPLNIGDASDAPKGARKLSEEGLSSIPPQRTRLGVSIQSARYQGFLSFAGLRRLGFERYDAVEARVMLAALCLYALTLRDAMGWSLRAQCELIPLSDLQFGLARRSSSHAEPFALGVDDAKRLFLEAVARVGIEDRNVRLEAGTRLNDLVGKAITASKADGSR